MSQSGTSPSLHNRILLGLVLGAVCGIVVNLTAGPDAVGVQWTLTYVMEPVGQIFLNMLLMTIVPLVFASLAIGVAKLGDLQQLGRIGAKTFAFFLVTMSCAVLIGLTLVNLIQPGAGLPEETRAELIKAYGGQVAAKVEQPAPFGIQTFVNIVTRNPLKSAVDLDMLGIIFFALLIGIGLTRIDPGRSQRWVDLLEGLNELMVVIIGLAMRIAPLGVFAFLFRATASFGFTLLKPLGLYVVVVLLGLALQMFGVLALMLRFLAGVHPLRFFHRVRDIVLTAFSTSSSSATLATSIKVTEQEVGVPPQIAGFVLPLGATMNMNGTALFEGVTVVFLSQVFGPSLDLGQQAIVVVLAVLTSIGAAGVPGGSIPLMAMVLRAVGVEPGSIALIIGVDRLLDMCRTTLNVMGDVTAAAVVARSEGFTLSLKDNGMPSADTLEQASEPGRPIPPPESTGDGTAARINR